MKTKLIAASSVTALLIALSAPAAQAGQYGAGINERQHHQQHRIAQGVRNGELTAREAGRLEREQARIHAEERRYRADGVLSAAERRDLHQDMNRASRHIYEQKHDAQQRHTATQDPGIDARQANQRQRIVRGARSGDLTGAELQALGAEQQAIREQEREYQSDGVLTHDERRELREDLRIANRNIQEERHDGERR